MEFSSLANLKAEVARKRNEANLIKLHSKDEKNKNTKDPIWAIKKKDPETKTTKNSGKGDPDEEKRVQSALEFKARLYNQMKSGEASLRLYDAKVQDKDGRFLINFNKTEDSDPSGDEKVPDLLSEDGRREMLRQKWEKEEEENFKKSKLHYNDVLFDEARTHGAAFYTFSKDEAAREKQLEELKQLHKMTKNEREEKEKEKMDKKTAMKNRLKKVRDRKRLKMGLPILENGSESEEETASKVDERGQEEEISEDLILRRLKEIRDKEQEAKQKAMTVREWDVGKKVDKMFPTSSSAILTMKPTEAKVMNQKEWMETKRSERPKEFAPPVNFYSDKKVTISSQACSSVLPPQEHQGQQKPNTQRHDQQPKHSQSHQLQCRGSQQQGKLRQQQLHPNHCQQQFQQRYFDLQQSGTSDWPRPGSSKQIPEFHFDNKESANLSISKNSRLEMHLQLKEGCYNNIINEIDDIQMPSPSLNVSSGHGVEIPPPCSMDYYSNVGQSKRSNWQGVRTRDELNEAFQFGMNQLKSKKAKVDDSDDSTEV